MRIIRSAGKEGVATVYLADMGEGRLVEFAESVQQPFPREKKWVLMISALLGCPVECLMCDAGGSYKGGLSSDEICAQIDYLVGKRFPGGVVESEKFKIQFARIGEPAFNMNVIDVLDRLPHQYEAPGLIACISTVAPCGTDTFFERLLGVKQKRYADGRFQLQFSIHSTDDGWRNRMIPIKKWSFDQIARYGERFCEPGDRKIGLNFAMAKGVPVNEQVLARYFSPEIFLIKITPVNPTYTAVMNGLESYIDAYSANTDYEVMARLRSSGYEVILSLGDTEENRIGSNCGQLVMRHLREQSELCSGNMPYAYWKLPRRCM